MSSCSCLFPHLPLLLVQSQVTTLSDMISHDNFISLHSLSFMKHCSWTFSKILHHPDYSVESSFVLVDSIPGSCISHFLWEMPCRLMTQFRILELCSSSRVGLPMFFPCRACLLPGALHYGLTLLERRLLKLFPKSCMGSSASDSFKYEFSQLHTILVLWMGLRF